MRTAHRFLVLAALIVAAAGCGDVIRQGRSPAILIVSSLQGIARSPTGVPAGTLLSDVVVLLPAPPPCSSEKPCPTIVDDFGQAILSVSMKNTAVPASPTNNQITVSRYTVEFRRADGRNTPGVDVPYGFDGAVTATVLPGATSTVTFEIVRHVAKQESPLAELAANRDVISTAAIVTFYGTDLVGNAVTAQGTMTVNFGNFADQ